MVSLLSPVCAALRLGLLISVPLRGTTSYSVGPLTMPNVLQKSNHVLASLVLSTHSHMTVEHILETICSTGVQSSRGASKRYIHEGRVACCVVRDDIERTWCLEEVH